MQDEKTYLKKKILDLHEVVDLKCKSQMNKIIMLVNIRIH